QVAPILCAHDDNRKVFDLSGLDERERFEQFVERAGAARHKNKSIGVFYEQRLAHEKVMQRHAAIQIRIWTLLEWKLEIATARAPADFFCAAVCRFHDARTAAGHDSKTEARDCC